MASNKQQPAPQSRPSSQPQSQSTRATAQRRRSANEALGDATSTLDMLRTQADRVRGLMGAFGFGRRILVPPDEIHVVVGDGPHTMTASTKSRVFGKTADRSSTYWLNRLAQVIKLKTISFTVPIRGINDEGVPALDGSKVSFRLWAHAVAKLNPEKAEVAAQRVGLDATSLINTISEVGTAELVAAAATMTLEDIIAARQKLAAIAFPQVNQILSELGYDLALLTITKLDGIAYKKLINQAESRISKETSIATNREQVAELQDDESRQRQEAEIKALTEKKLASERLEAEREVETATLNQQETLAIKRHEVQLRQVDRGKSASRRTQEADLEKVQLGRQLTEAEVEKEAQLAQLKAERQAELRANQQQRDAKIRLAETESEAERLALDQVRQIERDAERSLAEAKRLEQEKLAEAQRAKQVSLLQAQKLAESIKVEAESASSALQIKVNAETKSELIRADASTRAELIRAEAEATATEKRAEAAKIRAEATRAESAAAGLAEVEVEAARVQVSEQRVAVTRADGLAKAEVSQAQAVAEAERQQRLKEVEINAQRELVKLYDQAPVLVELERLRMQYAHEENISKLQLDAYLKAFEALAPSLQVRIYGDGGQTTHILTNLMSFAQGIGHLGDEIPVLGRVLNGEAAQESGLQGLLPRMGPLLPYLRQVVNEINPRMFSSLKVMDLMERLLPVVAGQEDLVTALTNIKDDANFRVVGDLPVAPLFQFLGIPLTGQGGDSFVPLDGPDDEAVVVEEESPVEDTDVNEKEADLDVPVA